MTPPPQNLSSNGRHERTPLYIELRRKLLERLMAREWRPGDRLPPEPQLAEEFEVSIGTVRKAVDALVNERILDRRQGRGTTVATLTPEHMYQLFFQIVDGEGRRIEPKSRLLTLRTATADRDTAAALEITVGSAIIRIDNLRLLKGRPVMLDRLALPAKRFPGLTEDGFAARPNTIYGFYQEAFGLTVIRTREDLTAVAATGPVARHLNILEGTCILRIHRRAFTFDGSVVEARYRYVLTEGLSYRLENGLGAS